MREMTVSIRTLAPLCHGGFGLGQGNAVAIRREPIVCLPGMPRVPCLSGNSIRGQVRRLVMRDLFARAGLGVGSLKGKAWDLLYGALANGGHLTGSEAAPSPGVMREIRESLPPLSVLGSSLYSYMLPGRARFGFAWPVCRETIAAGLTVGDSASAPQAGDIVTETGVVRHIDRDQQDPRETGVTPMPVTVEAISVGVELQCRVSLTACATDVEAGVIAFGLDEIVGLGGKCGSGFGMVGVRHDGSSAPYVEWLDRTGADALRQRLISLSEVLAK